MTLYTLLFSGILALYAVLIIYIIAQRHIAGKLAHAPDRESKYYEKPTIMKKFADMKDRGIQWTLGERMIKVDVSLQKYQTFQDCVKGTWSEGYSRYDRWTSDSAEELQKQGYLKVDGLYDSIVYWGVPVYMRINNASMFDIHVKDAEGNFIYSQDTAATLHDSMTSNATMAFLKGMNRIAWQAMDMQKIIMIAIVGAGAIFGLYMLGII